MTPKQEYRQMKSVGYAHLVIFRNEGNTRFNDARGQGINTDRHFRVKQLFIHTCINTVLPLISFDVQPTCILVYVAFT